MSEQSDTLRSKAYARLVDVLCEGEIEGLVDGARSIYLDGTALQAADGSLNFKDVKWVERRGATGQDYVPGFASVERVVAVNVQCKENVPVTRAIASADADAVLVTVAVPQLTRTDRDTGDIEGTDVRLQVQVQADGGSWVNVGQSTDVGSLAAVNEQQAIVPVDEICTRADLRVRVRTNDPTPGTFVLRIDYRLVGAPSWTTLKSLTLRADNAASGYVNINGTSKPGTYYTAQATVAHENLPAGRYEWRVVKTSGPTYPALGGLVLSGGYYGVAQTLKISGKTSSRYQRQLRVPKPGGATSWSVRVIRLTEDSDTAYRQNDTWWDSYTEIVEQKLRYPLTAYMAISLDAEQFSNIPSRAYDVKLLRVKVPSNYDPIARTYAGSWDGTFVTAWTDNPAWCFYDLLTNPRYGLGEFVGTGVDKWALYTIGQYCDELVPDGYGAFEPRFTCNVLIASRAEAFKVVNDLSSVFRGMVFWSSGSITAVHDAPSDPVALYTPANVIDGEFTYQGSSAKQRHTVALVTWNDPADMCQQKVEYVEDAAGIARYGVVSTEVVAFGCISRGQAHRVGKWLLFSERLQTEVVLFKASLDTALVRPGDVIKVADPNRAGARLGGRLVAATTAQVTLDAAVTLQAGQTYTFSCLKPTGEVQEATVTTAAGTTNVLALTPALAIAPQIGSIWVLGSAAAEPQLFQVLTVTESEPHVFEVSALEHDPGKYAAVELGLELQERSYSLLRPTPAAVENLTVVEALYASGRVLATRLDVSWTMPIGANAAVISWRRSDGTSQPEVTIYEPTLEITDAQEGQTYTISVRAMTTIGVSGPVTTIEHTVLGKRAAPSDVAGFVVARDGNTLNFGWRAIADLDAQRYEIRRGDTWDTGILVGGAQHPENVAAVVAPRGGTFLIKAVDTSGNYSTNAAVIVAADLSGINVVITHDEAGQGWPGALAGLVLYDRDGLNYWDNATSWDGTVTWDAMVDAGGVTLPVGGTTGTYTSSVVDLGYLTTATLSVDATIESLGPLSAPWTTYTDPWASYSGEAWVWQSRSGTIGAAYEVQTSEDGAAWTDWARFTAGGYRCRYLRIRVTLTTTDTRWRPFMTSLMLAADVPDRVLRFADVAVTAAGATIAFDPPFIGLATVQCTLQSAAVGDTVRVTAKSTASVTVQVFNSAGAAKAAVVDIDAYGYGEAS